jgi:uncharacterized protein (TIGR02996 family)
VVLLVGLGLFLVPDVPVSVAMGLIVFGLGLFLLLPVLGAFAGTRVVRRLWRRFRADKGWIPCECGGFIQVPEEGDSSRCNRCNCVWHQHILEGLYEALRCDACQERDRRLTIEVISTPQDRGFIEALASAPQDNALRLIYADWLEEHGDPRGEYLRTVLKLAELPPGDPRSAALEKRAAELRPGTDPGWRVIVEPPSLLKGGKG